MSTRLASQSWPSRAACLGQDTDLWFPAGTGDADPHAEATCRSCPVSTECLDFALATRQHGFWGGLTEDERGLERRRRMRRAAAEAAA